MRPPDSASTAVLCAWTIALASLGAGCTPSHRGIDQVKHVIIVVQENHSFDNYFGVIAYAPASPYHAPAASAGSEGCPSDDHGCVDGLSCATAADGSLGCSNTNVDANPGDHPVAFHAPSRCSWHDLDHTWVGSHRELNYDAPNDSLANPLNDGFVRLNDYPADATSVGSSQYETMGFYNQNDLPFYYALAETFAISDRYFCSILGPTFPNRSFLMAATSFGHLVTSDFTPPTPAGYKPITGTIFDLLDDHAVTWADFYSDVPQGDIFRAFGSGIGDPHLIPLSAFLAEAGGAPDMPPLPEVSFVDPSFGARGPLTQTDEHPPTDIQQGQVFVSEVVNAIRNGPFWKDSVIFVTYDEHGGFYDHVPPPRAPQGGARTPDGIAPGQCADLSNVPASLAPGGGAECASNLINAGNNSVANAIGLCPALAADPTGPFPADCAAFDQLGFRVPFMAISPFSKPSYVSHTVGDHTSLLAFIEERFMSEGGTSRPHLTARDQYADTLEDLFDFDTSPSLNTVVTPALPPAADCTPTSAPASTGP